MPVVEVEIPHLRQHRQANEPDTNDGNDEPNRQARLGDLAPAPDEPLGFQFRAALRAVLAWRLRQVVATRAVGGLCIDAPAHGPHDAEGPGDEEHAAQGEDELKQDDGRHSWDP